MNNFYSKTNQKNWSGLKNKIIAEELLDFKNSTYRSWNSSNDLSGVNTLRRPMICAREIKIIMVLFAADRIALKLWITHNKQCFDTWWMLWFSFRA